MTRDPSAPSRARRAEQKNNPISIKPLSTTPSTKTGGFKKGGFKNAFGPAEDDDGEEEVVKEVGVREEKEDVREGNGDDESDEDDGLDEGERYDPRRPTGCWAFSSCSFLPPCQVSWLGPPTHKKVIKSVSWID